jgi:hypothetical protein
MFALSLCRGFLADLEVPRFSDPQSSRRHPCRVSAGSAVRVLHAWNLEIWNPENVPTCASPGRPQAGMSGPAGDTRRVPGGPGVARCDALAGRAWAGPGAAPRATLGRSGGAGGVDLAALIIPIIK